VGGRNAGILAIDVGSSSVRARLYGTDFEVLEPESAAVCPYRWETRRGVMQCDPEVLLHCVAEAIDLAVVVARQASVQIEAVATTTFWHGTLGLDAAGHPLTPLYGWGDSRAREAVAELRQYLDEEAYHRATGCFLRPAYAAVKLFWLGRREPALFRRVRQWVSFGDHLEAQLFGGLRSSYSIASGTGLFDLHRHEWEGEVLSVLGLEVGALPELVELQPRSGLRREWARRWPELAGVPWFPALGDGACANLGSGAIGPARAGLTVGTTAAVRVIRPIESGSEPPDRLWEYRLDGRYRVIGGALSNGGNALAWLLALFPELSLESVDRALAAGNPDRHGLTVLPALALERGDEGPVGGALLAGLSFESGALEIVLAWLEASAHRLAELFEWLERANGAVAEVRASGGALHSVPGWLRCFADVFDRPVALGADREASCRGAAILAGRELGWIEALEEVTTPVGVGFEPEPEGVRAHRVAREREQELSAALPVIWMNSSAAPAVRRDRT
jgi:gluconokinase